MLGFNPWHHVLGSSSLNRLFSPLAFLSASVLAHYQMVIIRKKCLTGMRSTGSLPDGGNHGSSMSSCLRKHYAMFTPPETCAVRSWNARSVSLFRGTLWWLLGTQAMTPREFSKSFPHLLIVLMSQCDLRPILISVPSGFRVGTEKQLIFVTLANCKHTKVCACVCVVKKHLIPHLSEGTSVITSVFLVISPFDAYNYFIQHL